MKKQKIMLIDDFSFPNVPKEKAKAVVHGKIIKFQCVPCRLAYEKDTLIVSVVLYSGMVIGVLCQSRKDFAFSIKWVDEMPFANQRLGKSVDWAQRSVLYALAVADVGTHSKIATACLFAVVSNEIPKFIKRRLKK